MSWAARPALAGFLSCVLSFAAGCSRPSSAASGDASAAASRPPPASSPGRPLPVAATAPPLDPRPIGPRNGAARSPYLAPFGDAGPPPPVLRQPDWDLSVDDPARDYARRYVFFTRRYPDPECADLGPSAAAGSQRQVTVTTSASCPGAGAVRDVFLVDTAGDHLTVDDKNKRNPLARWPDGSDPEGPPGPTVRETTDMQHWKGPLQAAFARLLLVPLRVQAYGRGTYPVVSLAGWHAPYLLNAPPEALQPLADALCAANDNMPMALVAGFDRAHVLRVRCPASTRWELFQ